jgi:hypothetical protein
MRVLTHAPFCVRIFRRVAFSPQAMGALHAQRVRKIARLGLVIGYLLLRRGKNNLLRRKQITKPCPAGETTAAARPMRVKEDRSGSASPW